MNNCTLTSQQVNTLREKFSKLDDERNIIQVLNCLSSETRVKVLVLLKYQSEMSVCDIASVLDITVSAVSHQLRCLRDLNLVSTRRDGKNILYTISNNIFLTKFLELI